MCLQVISVSDGKDEEQSAFKTRLAVKRQLDTDIEAVEAEASAPTSAGYAALDSSASNGIASLTSD